MAVWFECKVRYDKIQENGSMKTVNEPYLVDATTFTEAEARIIEELTPYISGEFNISAVKKTKISEIFFNQNGDRYFNVKVNFISFDEKTGSEKKTSNHMLVQASDFEDSLKVFKEGMKETMADMEIASISESSLRDVFPYKTSL